MSFSKTKLRKDILMTTGAHRRSSLDISEPKLRRTDLLVSVNVMTARTGYVRSPMGIVSSIVILGMTCAAYRLCLRG